MKKGNQHDQQKQQERQTASPLLKGPDWPYTPRIPSEQEVAAEIAKLDALRFSVLGLPCIHDQIKAQVQVLLERMDEERFHDQFQEDGSEDIYFSALNALEWMLGMVEIRRQRNGRSPSPKQRRWIGKTTEGRSGTGGPSYLRGRSSAISNPHRERP